MDIKTFVWDKKTPINGKDAAFLSEHFKKQNGNDDRILFSYDGKITRIQNADDSFFSTEDKQRLNDLMAEGVGKAEAIAKIWREKAIDDYKMAAGHTTSMEQMRADIDYLLIMGGLE